MENILACTTNTYHNFGLEDALRGISQAKFQYVELAAVPGVTQHVYPEMSMKSLKEKLAKNGLKVSSLSAHSDFSQDNGRDYFKKCLEFARKLDVKIVNTGVGEPKDKEAIKKMFANLRECANYAYSLGINIALETHGDIMATSHKAWDVLRKIDSPAVGINYDTANVVFYSNVKPEDDLPAIVEKVFHVHLKDTRGGYKEWNFPALGKGRINFSTIFHILQHAHYQGPLSVEIEFTPGGPKNLKEVDEAVQESFSYLKQFFR